MTASVDDHTTLANNTTLGGHVHLADWVTVGGLTGIHQFVKVGAHAMVGFASAVSQDVPPFMLVDGNPMTVRGINSVGLRRRDFSAARLAVVKQMHRLLYRQGMTLDEARQAIAGPRIRCAGGCGRRRPDECISRQRTARYRSLKQGR